MLEGNVERFSERFERSLSSLATQEKNIRFQVEALKEEFYHELSRQLTSTYDELQKLVPELKGLYEENQKISAELQKRETEIGKITTSITLLAERIRTVRNRMAAIFQFSGQGIIILLLLADGIFLGRSITKPPTLLTAATDAVTPESIPVHRASIYPNPSWL